MVKIQPVILAGGVGSRLWPLSREKYPKQLLSLVGDKSLLQTTLLRVAELPGMLSPVVVAGEEHRFTTLAQIEMLDCFQSFAILLEPMGKNTAPAICGAAHYCKSIGEDVVLLVLPADHVVSDTEAFVEAVSRARLLALEGSIVTFGVEPTQPETGYGYIEKGTGCEVVSFKEKPDLKTAGDYVASGNYFWNSGMFAFTLSALLDEMQLHAPEIFSAMGEAVQAGGVDGSFFRFDKKAMTSCPSDSIDYALMEKTAKAVVVAADLGWSDVGSWQALWQVQEKDENGNVTSGDVILDDSRNCLVRSEKKLVAAVGLENTLVVETADAVLVSPLSCSQDVKKITARLKKEQRKEFSVHTTVYRPWGSYTVLEQQPRFQIKRITVNPGAKLSLQMHHHRSEHWVVVCGTARVTNGEKVTLLHENQSTYIPAGSMHRLENPGVIELELIEVQNGTYLGEDDIVRFDDVYGREDG
ncbi:mannose-1-phosphate guanylyltransferase/mannose-6-phosphate isomerase [Desulforhopalus singaporensis]|uniref:mannose-1-phosphate guanylyltransferase n=1 Tax=Desulforhopalus singaporensis TaxID=91360 RepID=A0A1H0JMA4_9BACT|nr:mannose-1-phosphate guanylyltransferase/mannose-6-phosphate isomerase [Desulforhopalus singaporensis]SDO44660.1 mannose-1-phosphate guanylyltransferase / mannose-6-phosphate isomerase [Desulforhopalus singaporensis]